MSEINRVYVTILDKDYQIACPPEERDALHNAADELDQRMRAIRNSGSVIGLERIAVMAALNLCHELQQLSRGKESGPGKNDEEILERISRKLDKILDSAG